MNVRNGNEFKTQNIIIIFESSSHVIVLRLTNRSYTRTFLFPQFEKPVKYYSTDSVEVVIILFQRESEEITQKLKVCLASAHIFAKCHVRKTV